MTPGHLSSRSQNSTRRPAGAPERLLSVVKISRRSRSLWREAAPDTTIVNEYGPTETAVGAACYQIPNGKDQAGSIPIGRAIPNTQVYILAPGWSRCRSALLGSYACCEGLARGYLNRPELTAEKFVPNPFGAPSSRLYRMGDWAGIWRTGT